MLKSITIFVTEYDYRRLEELSYIYSCSFDALIRTLIYRNYENLLEEIKKNGETIG